jgi:hypothetical protein
MNIIKRYFTPNENAAPYDRAWLRTKGALWSFNAFWALWFAVHIIVGTGSIVLPGLAAMSLTGHSIGGSDINILAGAGAISAAIYQFLRPHQLATIYEAASTEAWQVLVLLETTEISPGEAGKRIAKAMEIAKASYAGLSHK